jgi:hypothetical protein
MVAVDGKSLKKAVLSVACARARHTVQARLPDC